MTTVAVVQARMTSLRLPGKVLMDIGGAPMLAQQLRRLVRCSSLDRIVVATTAGTADDAVVECAALEGVESFRGDEHDVLGRYAAAARNAGADVIVRLTADCPLVDPAVVDRVVQALHDGVDYASNVLERTYPVGLDAEVLFRDTLERVDRLARSPASREHVTSLIRDERPELFLRHSVVDDNDNSEWRWTVDTPADLEHVRGLYDELGLGANPLPYRDVIAYELNSGAAPGR